MTCQYPADLPAAPFRTLRAATKLNIFRHRYEKFTLYRMHRSSVLSKMVEIFTEVKYPAVRLHTRRASLCCTEIFQFSFAIYTSVLIQNYLIFQLFLLYHKFSPVWPNFHSLVHHPVRSFTSGNAGKCSNFLVFLSFDYTIILDNSIHVSVHGYGKSGGFCIWLSVDTHSSWFFCGHATVIFRSPGLWERFVKNSDRVGLSGSFTALKQCNLKFTFIL